MTIEDSENEYEVRRSQIINLAIFEKLMGATRQKLPNKQCGLVHADKTYACFSGHGRFEMQECWEDEYHGPDFCKDLVWVFAAEAAARQGGLLEEYMEALVEEVYPAWNAITATKDVIAFWYGLAHASPMQRATALASAIETSESLEGVVERAMQLALPIATAIGDDDKETAAEPFLEFVRNLKPQRAEELLAVMYLGRGDHPTFELTLKVIKGASSDQSALARQMSGKAPLVRYLRDGLAKLPADRRS